MVRGSRGPSNWEGGGGVARNWGNSLMTFGQRPKRVAWPTRYREEGGRGGGGREGLGEETAPGFLGS